MSESTPVEARTSLPPIVYRERALDTSKWTEEELQLLQRWMKIADERGKIHAHRAERYANKNKWLRFIINFTGVLVGTGGVTAFFVILSSGAYSWRDLVAGLITMLAGVSGSVGESFEWEKTSRNHVLPATRSNRRSSHHDLAANRYYDTGTEIRTLRSTPGLDRRDCELTMIKLGARMSTIKENAPFIAYEDRNGSASSSGPLRSVVMRYHLDV